MRSWGKLVTFKYAEVVVRERISFLLREAKNTRLGGVRRIGNSNSWQVLIQYPYNVFLSQLKELNAKIALDVCASVGLI